MTSTPTDTPPADPPSPVDRSLQLLPTPPWQRPLQWFADADGQLTCRFEAPPGLHQLSAILDATSLDFEQLYYPLQFERNQGRRTGPWDFHLHQGNKPLIPSYHVELDNRRLGMWFFQRISLQDLSARRFRGRMAFDLSQGGRHTLTLTPFRPMPVRWQAAWLEPDPEDTKQPLPPGFKTAPGHVPVAAWTDPDFWVAQRHKLATTHAIFRKPLDRVFDYALAPATTSEDAIPALVAAHGLDQNTTAIDKALAIIDRLVAQPHWGNPAPDGYGHNGDMSAARAMLALTWSLHMLREQLNDPRRNRILTKLRHQGERFYQQALLTRDYWGGSLLQDHGWNAMLDFATAAMHLHGLIDEAERWLTFALPRVERALAAMPTDGAIPHSSHAAPWKYLERLGWFRTTRLALDPDHRDILDRPSLRAVVDFTRSLLHQPTQHLLNATTGDRTLLIGGAQIFSAIASRFRDGRAAWVQRQLLQTDPVKFHTETMRRGYYQSALWDFFAFDPAVEPVEPTRQRYIDHFADTGLVHWRDQPARAALTVQCAPWLGYNAYHQASGPCDRMAMTVGAGHFRFFLDGQPMLVTPDHGYALHTHLCNAMLVDNQGQVGDIGYPMSIPSWQHPGERVEAVQWNPHTGQGAIRLDLTPAYPPELGVIHYTREFLLEPDRQMICRDRVTLQTPSTLSWLFHGRQHDITLHDRHARFAHTSATLEARSTTLELHASRSSPLTSSIPTSAQATSPPSNTSASRPSPR